MPNVLTEFQDALENARHEQGSDERSYVDDALRQLIEKGEALLVTLQTPLRDIMALIETATPAFPPVALYDHEPDDDTFRKGVRVKLEADCFVGLPLGSCGTILATHDGESDVRFDHDGTLRLIGHASLSVVGADLNDPRK